ncbi:MAG: endonuclease/exonuclease/phosphatase family protein [Deferrisomatales bacterium]|nr:endonuclease/exonuclease/phosphatase family protein [Deferrisomatales bacterium]
MPTILDSPPANVRNDLDALRNGLDTFIPRKNAGDLLIATWNLRMFSSLTRKWTAQASDTPKRDLRGLLAIGEIVSRFDVVALQEVMGDLRALRDLLLLLGERWAFLMTDVTLGQAGNHERMAFLFDLERVRPSGLACELVVPPEWEKEIEATALRRQFARTPYAVSFKTGAATFILVTLHVEYGRDAAGRVPELRGIARWMAEWAARENRWHHNLLTLGDFNIDRHGDDLWRAFTSTGLHVPADLVSLPRTIFSEPGNPDTGKFYDQVAWFQEGSRRLLSMEYLSGGNFDFLPYVYTDANLSRNSISFRVSDHYPLWARFGIDRT